MNPIHVHDVEKQFTVGTRVRTWLPTVPEIDDMPETRNILAHKAANSSIPDMRPVRESRYVGVDETVRASGRREKTFHAFRGYFGPCSTRIQSSARTI